MYLKGTGDDLTEEVAPIIDRVASAWVSSRPIQAPTFYDRYKWLLFGGAAAAYWYLFLRK